MPNHASQIQASISEALGYLEARRDFWQQQKPVYARGKESARRLMKKSKMT